jgi:hypothetical protein
MCVSFLGRGVSKANQKRLCTTRGEEGSGVSILTMVHVGLSLIGIAAGFLVIFQMIGGKTLGGLNATFLTTTILTSVTGFFFPITKVTPGLVIGGISLLVLAIALFALYSKKLASGWRTVYVVTAVIAQFFNVLVLIVQSFMKIGVLHAMAPTGEEPVVKIVQVCALVLLIALGIAAGRKFHPAAA